MALVVALVAAVAGFALYLGSRVPDDAAAKVNDSYVSEDDVSSYIAQYRMSHSLTDDTALAQALSSQGMSVAQLRINAVNQLAITQLVNERASELGVSADESKVDEQISQLKSSLAFNDDSIWQRTLQQYGMTEDQLRAQYRNGLVQRAVCEKDVARREPTDDETLAYAKSSLAGSEQRHYTCIVFSGDDSSKKASGFADSLERYLANRSFSSEKATVPTVKERAKKAGASLSSYSWTLGLESGTDLTQELNDLAVGAMSDPQPNQEDSTTTIYLCDDSYRFPASARISSLEKGDVPATLWKDVTDKAADSLWSSDCSSYVAKLLAQASVTYYPVPEGAPYNVDLSSSAQSSDSAAGSSASSQSSDEN